MKKEIKGLKRRFTSKDISNHLGISPSTLRRYEKGIVKNPNKEIVKEIDKFWGETKKLKTTTDLKLKRNRAIQNEGGYFVKKEKFEKMGSEHSIYNIGFENKKYKRSELKKKIEHLAEKHDGLCFLRVKGIKVDENGKEQTTFFNTEMREIKKIKEDKNDLLNMAARLLNSPSKQFKRLIAVEVVFIDGRI